MPGKVIRNKIIDIEDKKSANIVCIINVFKKNNWTKWHINSIYYFKTCLKIKSRTFEKLVNFQDKEDPLESLWKNCFNRVAFMFLYNYIECQNMNTKRCYKSFMLDPTVLYQPSYPLSQIWKNLQIFPNVRENINLEPHLKKKKTWHLPIQPRINQDKKSEMKKL